MPDPENPTTPPTSDGERSPTLREIAERNYDTIAEGAPSEAPEEPGVDKPAPKRDDLGRFAKAEPGEAAGQPDQPSPEDDLSGTQPPERPTQPPPEDAGRSSEAPANWAEGDRQTFAKLPQEARDFLLRRHGEMEGEFQRRVQQYGAAAQFTEAVAPVFRDPVIQGSLQQAGIAPIEAINQWAAMHKRAYHPDPAERVALLHDIARNIGLNPAAVFASSQPTGDQGGGFSPEDLQDPAIRHIAEQFGSLSSELRAQRDALQQIRQAEQQTAQQQSLRVTRWGIDNFADEKGPDGKPLRPYFDRVLPNIIKLFRADPQGDLKEAYETACRMDPVVFSEIQRADAARKAQQIANQRAAQAARTNLRGRTAPVTPQRPNGADGQRPLSLRETIENAAEDLGF